PSGRRTSPRLSPPGDGPVPTRRLLRARRESTRHLHELTAGFTRYPQVLGNVRVGEKRPFADVPEIARAVRATEKELGDRGRLLLRYSGTEPLARVMIEGQRQDEIERLAQALARIIQTALGAK